MTTAREDYKSVRLTQICMMAAAKLATQEKDDAVDALEAEIRRQVNQSEVDTADNPQLLDLIGWGAKAAAQPVELPGQPRALDPVYQGAGTLTEWGLYQPSESPLSADGGPVGSYIIERREQRPGCLIVQLLPRPLNSSHPSLGFTQRHNVAIASKTRWRVQLRSKTSAVEKCKLFGGLISNLHSALVG